MAKKHKRAHSPRVTISLDDATIAAACRRSSAHCMIAEAVKLAVPDARGVSVDLQTIRWSDATKNLRYIYFTPRSAQVALIRFDRGEEPKPFSFELRGAAQITRPSPTHPRGARSENGKPAWRERGVTIETERKRALAEGGTSAGAKRSAALAAIDDPTAKLGSATLVTHADGSRGSAPTVIGGRPPASEANMAKKRRFGMSQYRE